MKPLFARGAAALLIAATALTAACSNNDPMAPTATAGANAARGATIGDPVHAGGYAVGWGRDSVSTSGARPTLPPTVGTTPIGGAVPTGGYAVGWGRGEDQ